MKISVPTAALTLKKEDNDMFQIYDSSGKMFPSTAGQWFATEWLAVCALVKLGMKVMMEPSV